MKLPPVQNPPATAADKAAKPLEGKMTLAEIEAKIMELKSQGSFGMDFRRQQDWMKIMADVEVADIPQLMAFVDKNMTQQMRWGLRYSLLARWADADVSAAMAYANSLPKRQDRESSIGIVASAWAAKDPKAAAEWMKQLPKGQLREQVLSSIVSAMAAKDPEAALALQQELGANNSRRFGMGYAYQIFSQWATKDPLTAAAKAAELPGQQRQQAYQAIASSWAQTDPQAAMTWANSLAGGNDKRNVLSSILSS